MSEERVYTAQFNSEDRRQMIETQIHYEHIRDDLHEHKADDTVRFKAIEATITQQAKYIYMGIGIVVSLQVVVMALLVYFK